MLPVYSCYLSILPLSNLSATTPDDLVLSANEQNAVHCDDLGVHV